MSRSYSSLDWVLSHWAHFTVHRFVICNFFMMYETYKGCVVRGSGDGGGDGVLMCGLRQECFESPAPASSKKPSRVSLVSVAY